ncbi:DNA alkylation repair protein [Celeribacter arenosi]|uniref:DNA alkylation repair protein n=1 Tax=Celeribacter arenosi TaxID=792649 RepID=A0ABP7KAC7_9RHOB
MTFDDALAALTALADPARAADLTTRFGPVDPFGVAPAALEDLARTWRQEVAFPARLDLARALWSNGRHEARIMAAKLLTQARIAEDGAVWDQIVAWIADARNWAEVDALASAGGRRIMVDLARLQTVYELSTSERGLERRAALQLSHPLAKLANPSAQEVNALDDILPMLTSTLADPDTDVSRCADAWLRSLAKHDLKRARMIRRVVSARKSDG